MAINQIGRINGAGLDLYEWRGQDFDSLQTYFESYIKELATAGYASGILYGGALSVQSGLIVAVTKLLANFSSQLVTFDASTITLDTADPTNPRIDRIELGFALVNNATVLDINGASKTFDKIYQATLYVNKGTAAPSPAANATTAGRLSLGLVTVNATQTLLTSASFDQSDYARDIVRRAEPSEKSATLANNQSAFADVPDLRFSSATTKRFEIKGYVYLSTASAEAFYEVTIKARFKAVAGTWSMDLLLEGPDVGVIEGMDFQINSASGKVQYKTPNIAGAGYVGYFKYRALALS